MEVDNNLEFSCEEFKSMLLNSPIFNPDDWILDNEDMSAPYPSTAELVQLAQQVYTDMEKNDHFLYEAKLHLPARWSLLTTACNTSLSNGYFGAAFYNSDSKQVVLAHRGTDPRNVGAQWTNLMAVVFKYYSARMSSAVTFADKVKCAILEANTPVNRFQLSATGHSLGGWLAQVTGLSVKFLQVESGKFIKIHNRPDSLHAHVVAFDSPGCKVMLEEILDTYDLRYRRTVSLEMLDITSYLSAPNRINTFGLHVGTIYRVMIDLSTFTKIDKHTLMYDLKTHSIDNFTRAFAEVNIKTLHKMIDWPVSKVKHIIQWKTEYTFFHQMVSHANNYHIDKYDETSMKVRYKAEGSDSSDSLRMFSDDELKLLNFWIIFNSGTVKTYEIQNFLTKHNLGRRKDLFLNFTIDNNSRIITCKTKKDLDMVVGRTKLLVRWFPEDLMAVVDQQSKEIPKIIYSMANQNYLDSLPKCVLDFTDSRLGEFLQSDHRIFQVKTEDCALEVLRLSSIVRQLREPSSTLDTYVKHGCQTFLSWRDVVNLNVAVDVDSLPENDFTNDNLLVIDCASADIAQHPGREEIFKRFLNNINRKLIFVSDYQKPDLNEFLTVPVVVGQLKPFESNQLTDDSQETLFKKKMLDIGDKILSIADFLGETNTNFDYFLSHIDSIIDARDLKKILRNENFVMKIENLTPNVIDYSMNFTTIGRKVSVESLVKKASSGELLVISGDRQGELSKTLAQVDPVAESGVIWVPEAGLAGERKFKQTILKNPNEKICWLQADDSSTTVKQIYHKSLYKSSRFHHRVVFVLEKFVTPSEVKDTFIFQGAQSKKSLMSLFKLPEIQRDVFLKNKNILTAVSDKEVNNILNKYHKNIVHLLKLEENGSKFLWHHSLGSLEGLRPYIHRDTDRPIGEEDLEMLKQKAVIIADEPGKGKSTRMASISQLLHTDWVIWIDLKYFKIPSGNVPVELRQRCEFLLRENLTQVPCLPFGLLQFCLYHEHPRQVHLMFDGFDEIKKDNSSKIDAKNEILKLLRFLKDETKARIWVTTRLYERAMLENALSTFAVTLEKIGEPQQREYLVNFWRTQLLLELEGGGDAMQNKLEECATAVLTEAKNYLGEGIQRFTGVPLQLRMLAEVFLQKVDDYVGSQIDIGNIFEVESVSSLYEKFNIMKYDIYCKGKIELNLKDTDYAYKILVADFTKTHKMLGFNMLFPQFVEEYYKDFASTLEEAELCRIGLVQTSGNGCRNVEFIHHTLAEFFCAKQIVYLLRKDVRCQDCRAPTVELLLTYILLQDSNKTIRMFINELLLLQPMSNAVLPIGKLWEDKQHLLFDIDLRTALHAAVEENNEGIMDFLINGLMSKPAQKGLIGFVAARDRHGDTVLGLASRKAEEAFSQINKKYAFRTMKKLVQCFETWTYEMQLELLLATYIKGCPLILLGKYLMEDSDCLKIKQAFVRTRQIITKDVPPFLTAVEERKGREVDILYSQMKNDVECSYILYAQNRDGDTTLHLTAQAADNQIEIIKLLCERSIHGIERSYSRRGETPLHCAAKAGHLNIVMYFKNYGVRIDCLNVHRQTALHSAAGEGHLAIVEYLVDIGAAITSADIDGYTSLHIAAENGHLSVVKYLHKMGADINSAGNDGRTAVRLAAEEGHVPVVEYLLQKKVDISFGGRNGGTLLHRAAEKGYFSMVKYLVENGVDINFSEKDGRTALHRTAEEGHLSVVKYLVKKQMDINSADEDGYTALHKAANNGHLPVVMYLVEDGVHININSAAEKGYTALHVAAYSGHLCVVKYLVEKGMDISFATEKGNIALHGAAYNGHLPVVAYLFKNGMDINADKKHGCATLFIAAFRGFLQIVEYLIDEGMDLNSAAENGDTALHKAAYNGHLSVVEYLVDKGVEINYAKKNRYTALHIAAYKGYLSIVKYLVDKGVNINSAAESGYTALHNAAYNGHLSVVKYLVDKGMDINSASDSGYTALHNAAYNGHLSIVRYLVEKRVDIHCAAKKGDTALHYATFSGYLPVVEYLVEKEMDINSVTESGHTPLHNAAYNGHLQVVEYLVEKGVDINYAAVNCDTALHKAAYNGHLSIVKYLIEKAVDINPGTDNSSTVLHKAAYNGHLSIVKYLVEKGVDINSPIENGSTVLHKAAYSGHLPILEYLIKMGADINFAAENGDTALHKAAYNGHLMVMKYLVEIGADIHIQKVNSADVKGDTALHKAAYNGHLSTVKYLVENGLDINSATENGSTALHKAAYNGHLSIVQYLVEEGADINSAAENGDTALYKAAYKGHLPVVKYIVDNGVYTAKDRDTALHAAVYNKHSRVEEYLKGHQI